MILENILKLSENSLLEEENKLKEEYELLMKEEKDALKEQQKLLDELRNITEKEEKIGEEYFETELNSINESKKIFLLRNRANILTYQLTDFEKHNIINDLFEFTFNDKTAMINNFHMTGTWPIEYVKINSYIIIYLIPLCAIYIAYFYDFHFLQNVLNDFHCGWASILNLTCIISYKFKFRSNKYNLYPYGVDSKIVNYLTKEIFHL